MTVTVGRRELLVALGGATVAWPLPACAQQLNVWRVGMLETISAELNAANLGAFRRGLRELGYVEGRNLILAYRSADGDAKRFPGLVCIAVRHGLASFAEYSHARHRRHLIKIKIE